MDQLQRLTYLSALIIVSLFAVPSLAQEITIGSDGIVRCKDVPIGTTQTVGFDTYEVVDRNLLIQRRNQGADMTYMCVSNVSDMKDMFRLGTNLSGDITKWDVSSVTDMSNMFNNKPFNQDISQWDVSKVTNMFGMFFLSTFNKNIDNWDVSSVTNMSLMFGSNSVYNQPLSSWDVSSVTEMESMFGGASAFNQDISTWDVSNVTSMREMFGTAENFNQPIGSWDVSSVTNMYSMFRYAYAFNQEIGQWDVSNVTNMSSMFVWARNFNRDLSGWSTSNVTEMDGMFSGASKFNGDISAWDVSSVISMGSLFMNASEFSRNLADWDVSEATQMNEMFHGAVSMDSDLSNWCVRNVSQAPRNFANHLGAAKMPNWGTCPGLPGQVVLSSPLNNAEVNYSSTTFSCEADPLATKYNFQIVTAAGASIVDTETAAPSFSPTSAIPSQTTYLWRVAAVNENKMVGGSVATGDWSDVRQFTVVNYAPTAAPAVSVSEGPAPLEVAFDASGSSDPNGDALTYTWDFKDGSAATGATPTHSFAAGTYEVLLTVSDGELSASETVIITATNTAPVANIVASVTDGLYPLEVSFDASGSSDANGDALTYAWDFGDGSSSSDAAPTHTFSEGSFDVSLTVSDGALTNSTSVTITATNAAPVASLSASDIQGQVPFSIDFNASASTDPNNDTLTFAWDFGDGATGEGVTASHVYEVAGTYTVTLTVSDGTLTDTVTIAVVITANVAPVASLSASATEGLAPLEVSFDASGSSDAAGDALTYAWDFKDGTTSTDVSPTHTFAAGTYDVTLIVSDGVLADTATVAITATNAAPQAFALAFPKQGQAPHTVDFNASTSTDPNGDALTFAWDFGDGATGSGETASHTYTAAGEYTVVLTASDGVLTGTDSLTVSIASGVDTESLELPETFVLKAAYPNPFNPTTTVTYGLPAASEVRITATDLLGRQVATLMAGDMKAAGYHTVQFNADGLASGSYLIRMEAGDFVATQQVVLLK